MLLCFLLFYWARLFLVTKPAPLCWPSAHNATLWTSAKCFVSSGREKETDTLVQLYKNIKVYSCTHQQTHCAQTVSHTHSKHGAYQNTQAEQVSLFQPSYFFLSLGVEGHTWVTNTFCLYTSFHFLLYSFYLFSSVLVNLNVHKCSHTQSTVPCLQLYHHMAFWASLTESWLTCAQTCLCPGTHFLVAAYGLCIPHQSAVKCWPLRNRHHVLSWQNRTCALIIPRSQTQIFSFVIHWFFNPLSQPYVASFSSPPFLPFFLLPPPLFLASGVPVLLIRPYQWSNLAATAWVSVARRAAPLSCPAVAEINPQIEQSPRWPLQTPKSCSVHPSNRDSLCLKLFS